MKILNVLAVLAVLVSTLPSHAGVSPQADLPANKSKAVEAVQALITRCLAPVIQGRPAVATGLFPAGASLSRHLLGERNGQVWVLRDYSLMLVDHQDLPDCRVMAFGLDPVVLGDIILGVFREQDTPFTQKRFRIDEGGGFAAVYTADQGDGNIVVRISTAVAENGVRFATLSVSRSAAISN